MKMIGLMLFVLMALMVLPLMARAQDVILGQWNMDRNSLEMDMREEDKERFSKLPNQKRIEIIEELGSRVFEFLGDGSFRAEWTARDQEQVQAGTWYVEGDQLFIDTGSDVKSYKVLVLNKKKLVLVPDAKVGFFQKLVFTKSE